MALAVRARPENVFQVLFRDLVEFDKISKSSLLAFDVDRGHCCELLLRNKFCIKTTLQRLLDELFGPLLLKFL